MDVLSAIRLFGIDEKEKNIAVALSGGADSMALLMGLYILKDELQITLSALHLNHCLRAEESDRDEAFVKEACSRLGVPLTVERVDVGAVAQKNGISTELAARQVRYDFFERNATGMVATAHNADDNLETVIYRLTRVTGINGLCSIPERRGIYIRPLLCCSREEIEAFLKENNTQYVTDSTNLTDEYTRNRIRHSVIPVLKQLNPSVAESFYQTAKLLKADRDCLERAAKQEFSLRFDGEKLSVKDYGLLDGAIASRVITMYFEKLGFEVNNYCIKGVTDLAVKGEGRFQIKEGRMLKVSKGFLMSEDGEIPAFKTEIVKQSVGEIKINGKIHNLFLKNAIDCDKIEGNLTLRTRQSGDSIAFLHRRVSKPLKKWMNEEGIGTQEREVWPVISDDKGVVWVYGGGVDKRVCPDENTRFVYRVFSEKLGGK